LQQRDWLSAIDARVTHFGIIKFADFSGNPTCTEQVVVVKGEEYTVTSGVHIGFKVGVSKFDRSSESRHGVFWSVTCTAPMGKCDWETSFEKWM
jgi:hypothetical protein